MSESLALELEILRDVLAAVIAGEQVIEIKVSVEVWWRLHAERPKHAYLFAVDVSETHRGFLGRTPLRPDVGTAHWRVITAEPIGSSPAWVVLH